jgi:hypothetical protein
MTPLFEKMVRRAAFPKRERESLHWLTDASQHPIKDFVTDVHCFEYGAVAETAHEMALRGSLTKVTSLGFLPAKKTWLERTVKLEKTTEDGDQELMLAILFVDRGDGFADIWAFTHLPKLTNTCVGYFGKASIDRRESGVDLLDASGSVIDADDNWFRKTKKGLLWAEAVMAMAMINSPKIIGRTQHVVNGTMQRKLNDKYGVGKFPLHAWTTIKLEVGKPPEIDDGEPQESILTGRRALHFCRTHLRFRLGKLEYVREHWRGDAAIGIKRSRYEVTTAPR